MKQNLTFRQLNMIFSAFLFGNRVSKFFADTTTGFYLSALFYANDYTVLPWIMFVSGLAKWDETEGYCLSTIPLQTITVPLSACKITCLSNPECRVVQMGPSDTCYLLAWTMSARLPEFLETAGCVYYEFNVVEIGKHNSILYLGHRYFWLFRGSAQSAWIMTEGYRINSIDESYSSLSLADCQDLCLTFPRFVCRSVSYKPGNCSLHRFSKMSDPVFFIPDLDHQHYDLKRG